MYFDFLFGPGTLVGTTASGWSAQLEARCAGGVAVLSVAHFSHGTLGRCPRPIHYFRHRITKDG